VRPFFDKMQFFWWSYPGQQGQYPESWIPEDWAELLPPGYRNHLGTPLYLSAEDAEAALVRAWDRLPVERRAELKEYEAEVERMRAEIPV